jgi:transcriptional regulator with XRE-family HTH domain
MEYHPLADLIRQARTARRLSQEAVGLAAGVSRALVGKYERMTEAHEPRHLGAVARAAGVAEGDLMRVVSDSLTEDDGAAILADYRRAGGAA